MTDPDGYGPDAAISNGLKCRCPRCGHGRLFYGFLNVCERCEVCGLDLRAHDSGDGPAVFVSFILGAVFVPLAFWVELSYAPPLWVHMLLWFPMIIGLTALLIRPLKGMMIGLQYRHRSTKQQD